ncbi:MAG TPA: helix-turn-helix transcriptional regulator [Opitutaceae bacterium]|nr:helix-turn-helix transcriptional regulator [Opitutaceae bacterium]
MNSNEQEAIHVIWDKLTDFSPAQTDEALSFLFGKIAELTGANNMFWMAAVRILPTGVAKGDHGHGWRMRATELWRPDPLREQRMRLLQKSLDRLKSAVPIGTTTTTITAESGRFRAHRMRDGWVDFAAFRASEHYDIFYRKPGIGDRLWVVFPVNPDAESYFIIDKIGSRSRFSAADAACAAYLLRGIKWFHRQLMLSRGLLAASTPLTATERRVVHLLLTGQAEKEIAHSIGLTTGTTHNHVGQIYRKFGVRSRAELMALWLGLRG